MYVCMYVCMYVDFDNLVRPLGSMVTSLSTDQEIPDSIPASTVVFFSGK